MKSNLIQNKIEFGNFIRIIAYQIVICFLLTLVACSSSDNAKWNCNEPLPGQFKILRSQSGSKYAIQSSWSRERIDDYNEKEARYKYYYHYLAENENGWVVEVSAGG